MNIIVMDTETTGIPDCKSPSDSEHQPHIVELAAIKYDEQGNELASFTCIVRPDGWEIPQETVAVHGIDETMAEREGISEALAVANYLQFIEGADLIVGHNVSFDDRIMRIALKRYLGDEAAEAYKETPRFCTCVESTDVCQIPKVKGKGFKRPKLSEAYSILTAIDLEDAHGALTDARAAALIYFALQAAKPAPAAEEPFDDDSIVTM